MNEAMKQFFTRERANEGIRLPLYLPDGSESEHWIQIRGVDSDAFRGAEAASKRRTFAAISEANGKIDVAEIESAERLEVLSSLVQAWSFDQPCTPENIKAFLREAPQIADQINKLSVRRSLFFANSSKPSTPSPVQTSS